jgi:hypothetical protein
VVPISEAASADPFIYFDGPESFGAFYRSEVGDRRFGRRLVNVADTLRVRDVETGTSVSVVRGPLDMPTWDVAFAAAREILVATRNPTSRGRLLDGTVTAYNIKTGAQLWHKIHPRSRAASDSAEIRSFLCSGAAVCTQQAVKGRGVVLVARDLRSGKQLWEKVIVKFEELPREPYLPMGYTGSRLFLSREFGADGVLVLDTGTGEIVTQESGWLVIPAGRNFILLRGVLEGPRLGQVEVRLLNTHTGVTSGVGMIETAAYLCRASAAYLVCPDAQAKMRAWPLMT